MFAILKIIGGVLSILVLSGGLFINSQRAELMDWALSKGAAELSEKLGMPVKIGSIDLNEINILNRDKSSDVTIHDIEVADKNLSLKIDSIDLNKINIWELDRNSDVIIHNLKIFDKNSELIAGVDKADIDLKPVIILREDVLSAVNEIKIDGVLLNLKKREDDSWNFNDIKLESKDNDKTELNFDAKIFLERGTVNANFDGKSISVEEISGEADCANINAIATKLNAKTLGAQIKANGTLGKEQQVVNAEVDNIFFDKIIPYLPENIIPEGTEILRGSAKNTSIHLLRKGETLNYLGSTEIKGAAVKVNDIDIESIFSTVTFNEREIILDGSAVANGQQAAASGKIHLDTDETFFDLYAESYGFKPSAMISDIAIDCAVDIRAHVIGTAKNPQVDADIYSDWLAYENYSAQNISTKLHYVNGMIYLNDMGANLLGGNVTGAAEIKIEDLSFSANVKANGFDAATLCNLAGTTKNINGKIFADLGINGSVQNLADLKIYGNAKATALNFDEFLINETNASFHFSKNLLTIDYLSAKLPDNGTIGLEGKINDFNSTDLNFYGAHINISNAQKFHSVLDMSGLADFKGTVRGNLSNPNITLELSAVDQSKSSERFKGELFKQPFDSIQLIASGSLDGINIDKFNLEKDGKLKWTVIEGTVGLTGAKNINIRLDTTQARAENIIELVAPEIELTGNVSNTIKVTGTFDKPKLVGNLKFNRGSIFGILVRGVEGDYLLEDKTITLQNFEVTSPMIDMVLNGKIEFPAPIFTMVKEGTIEKDSLTMDLKVTGNDINLQRFKSKLPEKYNAEGHVKFEGSMRGKPSHLILNGELSAEEIFLNGVALKNVYGHAEIDGSDVRLTDFHFSGDDNSSCKAQITTNLETQILDGEIEVNEASIAHMLTIFDKKNELIDGTLNSKILLNGTLIKPQGSLTGKIPQGTFANCDIHDINVDIKLFDDVIYINRLDGKQGNAGTINLQGKGAINLHDKGKILRDTANRGSFGITRLEAKNIEWGLFSNAAGYEVETVGTADVVAELKGTVEDPFIEVILISKDGGIKDSTFDLLHGHFLIKNQRVNVEELMIQRELSGKTYGASMEGFVPIRALLADSKENLPNDEQLDLTVSLANADLILLKILSPAANKYIKYSSGNLEGSIKVTGTAARPQFNGKISLQNGSIKFKSMKTLVEDINVSMLFKGERFDIENFSGNIGGGTFALMGGFNFPALEPKDYNFDFAARNLNIDSDFYDGLFNADFNFSEVQTRRRTLPKLSGQINLEKCRIGVPPLPEDDDSPLPEFILDVALNLGEKVHFYDPKLYGVKIDAYLQGNVQIEGTTTNPRLSQGITVKPRGSTLTYLGTVFNIQTGEISFNRFGSNEGGSFMPNVRFEAETEVANTKIKLNLEGQPNNDLEPKLTSSPAMTQQEIITLLTLRDAYSKGGEVNLTTEDALAIGLQMTLIGSIEEALKKTVGIDQFTASRGSGSMFDKQLQSEQSNRDNARDYNVKIGKYINDKLMIRYTRGFGDHKVNRYGLHYDFNDNLGFTIEREGKDYVFSFEARYKF